eukprot:4711600-Amphidinium_carterae.1
MQQGEETTASGYSGRGCVLQDLRTSISTCSQSCTRSCCNCAQWERCGSSASASLGLGTTMC